MPSFARIRAIVFDLDGTLYQSDQLGEEVNLAACRYAADLQDVSVEEGFTRIESERIRQKESGGTLSKAIEALGGTLQELHQRLSDEVHPEGVLAPDPRVLKLLQDLGARYELVIYTNNNRALSARIMKEIGVYGMFARTYTIQDFWRPKPDRDALSTILKEIGHPPEEVLFVGDRYDVDLRLPRELGCPVLESQTIEELLQLRELCK
ncbi:HAD family hydrolase [Geomonas sp. Red875]|uniref:phosphoglycolate phosphatase n=1 Tax=Geomesophilobacter sediminis TaxID=2798584 RepID=A0A8J7M355_9BACT|nr:HAD family hydrolase [Geomesophilobacter sediminis]